MQIDATCAITWHTALKQACPESAAWQTGLNVTDGWSSGHGGQLVTRGSSFMVPRSARLLLLCLPAQQTSSWTAVGTPILLSSGGHDDIRWCAVPLHCGSPEIGIHNCAHFNAQKENLTRCIQWQSKSVTVGSALRSPAHLDCVLILLSLCRCEHAVLGRHTPKPRTTGPHALQYPCYCRSRRRDQTFWSHQISPQWSAAVRRSHGGNIKTGMLTCQGPCKEVALHLARPGKWNPGSRVCSPPPSPDGELLAPTSCHCASSQVTGIVHQIFG